MQTPTSSIGTSAARASHNVMCVPPEPPGRCRAFTLIEMMVVTALMGLIVATASVGMSGFTEAGRWRAATSQIDAANRQARLEAWSTGIPRRIVGLAGSSRILLQRPRKSDEGWVWTLSRRFELPRGTRIESIVLRNGTRTDSIRIGSDGAGMDFGCVLRRGDRMAAVVIDGWSGQSTLVMNGRDTVDAAHWFDQEVSP